MDTEQVTRDEEETSTQTSNEEQELETPSQETPDAVSEKGKTLTDKEIEELVTSRATPLAQSITDKAMRTYHDELRNARAKIAELEVKRDDEDIAVLYGEESDELGVDEARKRRDARTRQNANFKTFREQSGKVAEQYKEVQEIQALAKQLGVPKVSELANTLGATQRDQNARDEAFKIVLPEGKEIISEMDAIVKRLTEAETQREFDVILKAIQAEYKSTGKTRKTFQPDSSRGAGGGVDFNKLTPDEKLKKGFAALKKK